MCPHPKCILWVREGEKGSTTQKLDHLPSQHGNQLHLPFPDEAGNTEQKGKRTQ